MRKIACMSQEWREIMAYLEVIKIFSPDLSKEEKAELKKIDDTVTKIGQATFTMDIVSHLSMKANVDEGYADAQ